MSAPDKTGKRHKFILEDVDSGSAECTNDDDELMIVSEDCSADPQLLINEIKEQIVDEKANVSPENENVKTTPLLLHGSITRRAVSRLPL